jgi:small subunit ribosomal protein S4
VNGRRTNIPSFIVRPGDVIAVRDGSRNRKYFKELRAYMEERPPAPEWLSVDMAGLKGTVEREPERRDIDIPLNEQLIVEYYSR